MENDASIRTSKEERKRFAELRKAGKFSYVRGHDQVYVPGSSPAAGGGGGGVGAAAAVLSPAGVVTPRTGSRGVEVGAVGTPRNVAAALMMASGAGGMDASSTLTPGGSLRMVQSPAGGPRVYTTPGYTPQVSIQQKTFDTDPQTLDKRPWEQQDDGLAPPTAATAAAAAAAMAADVPGSTGSPKKIKIHEKTTVSHETRTQLAAEKRDKSKATRACVLD